MHAVEICFMGFSLVGFSIVRCTQFGRAGAEGDVHRGNPAPVRFQYQAPIIGLFFSLLSSRIGIEGPPRMALDKLGSISLVTRGSLRGAAAPNARRST
jgi:hypothetical protein